MGSLNLWQTTGWSADTLSRALSSWPALESVELRFCAQVTDALILQLIKECSSIRDLGVAYCVGVTDIAIEQLSKRDRAEKLVWLNVRGCPQVTQGSLRSFALAKPDCSLLYDKG